MSSVINDTGLLDVFITWSGPMKKLLLDVNIKYLFSFQKVQLCLSEVRVQTHSSLQEGHKFTLGQVFPDDLNASQTFSVGWGGWGGWSWDQWVSDRWRVGGCWTVHTCFIPQWRVWELRVGFISDETCIFWSVWTGSEPYTVCVTKKKKNRLNHFLSKTSPLILFVMMPRELIHDWACYQWALPLSAASLLSSDTCSY